MVSIGNLIDLFSFVLFVPYDVEFLSKRNCPSQLLECNIGDKFRGQDCNKHPLDLPKPDACGRVTVSWDIHVDSTPHAKTDGEETASRSQHQHFGNSSSSYLYSNCHVPRPPGSVTQAGAISVCKAVRFCIGAPWTKPTRLKWRSKPVNNIVNYTLTAQRLEIKNDGEEMRKVDMSEPRLENCSSAPTIGAYAVRRVTEAGVSTTILMFLRMRS